MSYSQCTGYTHGVLEGTVTDAKDYIKMCLHAFGVMIRYRDDPLTADIPDSIPLDSYHVNQIDDKKRKLEEVKARNTDLRLMRQTGTTPSCNAPWCIQ